MKSFASDNYAGVAPEIMAKLHQINQQHAVAYGDDIFTKQAIAEIQTVLTRPAKVVFVFTGTAANTLAIKLTVNSYHSIICSDCAHIAVHEVNAPVAMSGAKLVGLVSHAGKISAEQIKQSIAKENLGGRHNNQPKMVSITQPTEMGTVYTLEEIAEISKVCKDNQLYLHMDGCRLYNAAITLNVELAELTQHVDILSLGGTKNGLMFGEAVVIFNQVLAEGADYLQKQLLQLDSKMRYLSAQFIPFFADKLWKKYAAWANAMAKQLADGLSQHPDYQLCYPVKTNMIFVRMPLESIGRLQQSFPFEVLDEHGAIVRLVTAFDTTEEEIQQFLSLIWS